jgi:hypothetical protein
MSDDSSKGTADTAALNPSGFVPGVRNVPTGSTTFAILGISKVAKLENTTITTAFAIFSKFVLFCVTVIKQMIAVKIPVPTMGFNPSPGKLSTSNGPTATVPYARKQLLLTREAPAVRVPAV